MTDSFERGDFIEVKWTPGRYTGPDFGTIRGTALDSRGSTGYADFRLLVSEKQILEFNLNYVEVTNLFRANVARGDWNEEAKENVTTRKDSTTVTVEYVDRAYAERHIDWKSTSGSIYSVIGGIWCCKKPGESYMPVAPSLVKVAESEFPLVPLNPLK